MSDIYKRIMNARIDALLAAHGRSPIALLLNEEDDKALREWGGFLFDPLDKMITMLGMDLATFRQEKSYLIAANGTKVFI